MMKVVRKMVGKEPEVVQMEKGLKAMQEAVGGWIERVEVREDIDMWLNEEGMLIDLPLNLYTLVRGTVIHQIVGNVFFASHDYEGNTVGLNEEQVEWVLNRFVKIGITVHPKHDDKIYPLYGLIVR